jgi:hypothetical protein
MAVNSSPFSTRIPICSLCGQADCGHFATVRGRVYWRCRRCDLAFLDPSQHPDPAAERAEYRLHQNDPEDPRYQRHLKVLTDPLVAGLEPGTAGLDFGAGPGPAIKPMLAGQGFPLSNYDPCFWPDEALLQRRYGFIACTEVAEHFFHPGRSFDQLAALLLPGGRLGIMTSMLTDGIDFEHWYYIREISHVAFYSPKTFAWLAARHGWRLRLIPPRVALFDRPSSPA